MKYAYTCLLLHKAGIPITEESITKVLNAARTDIDTTIVKRFAQGIEDININEVKRLALLPKEPTVQVIEEKKEEPKQEKEHTFGIGDLFG